MADLLRSRSVLLYDHARNPSIKAKLSGVAINLIDIA